MSDDRRILELLADAETVHRRRTVQGRLDERDRIVAIIRLRIAEASIVGDASVACALRDLIDAVTQ